MITKVQAWGNSQGLRLNKQLLADVGIEVGDEVDATIHDGSIIVTPVKNVRGKCNLKELIKQIPNDYQTKEVDWGKPNGKEVW
jgi:antitoxin MazE